MIAAIIVWALSGIAALYIGYLQTKHIPMVAVFICLVAGPIALFIIGCDFNIIDHREDKDK